MTYQEEQELEQKAREEIAKAISRLELEELEELQEIVDRYTMPE